MNGESAKKRRVKGKIGEEEEKDGAKTEKLIRTEK